MTKTNQNHLVVAILIATTVISLIVTVSDTAMASIYATNDKETNFVRDRSEFDRFLSDRTGNQDSRSLFVRHYCSDETYTCQALLFGGRRMHIVSGQECTDKCSSTLFVPLKRLFGWKCGRCPQPATSSPTTTAPTPLPTASPTTSPTVNPGKQVCSSTTKIAVTNCYPYNKIVLQGFDVNQVEWDVSYASRRTSIEFTLPYRNSTEEEELKKWISTIKSIEVNTSAGFESRLTIPDPTTIMACNSSNANVHITVPKTVSEICIGMDLCRPVTCSLGSPDILDRTDVSYAPGNAEIFFGNSTHCVIQKPTLWDEYIVKHFGNSTLAPSHWYSIDADGDGASNIVEYYGINLMNLFAKDVKGWTINTPTDPKKADTDGDLLLDGYEMLFGSDPLTFRNVTSDADGDGLTDLQEQIFGTDLFYNDTDNDGVSDQTEFKEGSNPLDDTDFFSYNRSVTRLQRKLEGNLDACTPQQRSARIRLTVGDPSGSESERYKIIVVGVAAHESPGFGSVDSGDYSLLAGTYTVRVEHVASKYTSPDYDYFAAITSLESPLNWTISVSDPDRILGSHSESTFDYTIGRSAILTVIRVNAQSSGACSTHSSCVTCRTDMNCRWSTTKKVCTDVCNLPEALECNKYINSDTCPCVQCEKWAQIENTRSRQWIDGLPKCPCRVQVIQKSSPLKASLAVDNSTSTFQWERDSSCNPQNADGCEYYHPRAYGCIRAGSTNTSSISGQQCCYDNNGKLIRSGIRGAGRPALIDEAASNSLNPYALSHIEVDVQPFNRCCKECEDDGVCAAYIGSNTTLGVRQDNRTCVGPN